MARIELKVIRLIEPDLCLECRFAQKAVVAGPDGEEQLMIHCLRRDCDNWDYESVDEKDTYLMESSSSDLSDFEA